MLIRKIIVRTVYATVLLLTIASLAGISVLLESKKRVYDAPKIFAENTPLPDKPESFPVSVDTRTKIISENPATEAFFSTNLAHVNSLERTVWDRIVAVFASNDWYQNLASPVSRIVVIWPGERKEELTKNIGDILRWNKEERLEFQRLTDATEPVLADGKYFPGKYVTHRKATPEEVYLAIQNSFQTEILSRYTPEVERAVPLKDALIVASLLEREASDFDNMREVSGVIWNRLFIDMPLQLDATLQYAKINDDRSRNWWPKVIPPDKFIESSYNTYQHKGLPPAPIANPSTEAILAALNPIITNCMYYFHTQKGEYYCSETYEEHVAKLKSLYGQGS